MYAYIENGEIIAAFINLPSTGVNLTTGQPVPNLPEQPVAVQEACGYFLIGGDPRPAPDDFITGIAWDANVSMVSGRPVATWSQRPPLTDETRAQIVEANTAAALDVGQWITDIADLKLFLTDPDIQTVLDQPNNTALTAQQLNRALKVIIRQLRRNANMQIRMSKMTMAQQHPEVLEYTI